MQCHSGTIKNSHTYGVTFAFVPNGKNGSN
jgi:hypothetical protein